MGDEPLRIDLVPGEKMQQARRRVRVHQPRGDRPCGADLGHGAHCLVTDDAPIGPEPSVIRSDYV